MPPLRVLIAIGSLDVGGAERQAVRYLKHLDRGRFAPGLYLISRRGPLLDAVPGDVPVYAFDERILPGRVYLPGGVHRRQVRDLAAALDEFSADLLVTRTFHLTLPGAAAARRRPTPLVAVDANDPRRDFRRHAGRFQALKRRMIGRAYRNAAAVVALSDGAADGLSEFYGVPRDRVSVLPNLVDLDEIDRLAAEPGPDLVPGRFHVAAVGRLAEEKGHRYLLEAVRLLRARGGPDVQLHLLGDGPLRASLEVIARDLGVADRVTFAGFCANPFAYVRRCDLFCLPSLNEGMPGALLEAMACGTPVVATDCPSGPREVLDGGRFGRLVPVADTKALADAIATIAGDGEGAKRVAVAARRRVEEEYSLPVGIARLEAILNRAAGRSAT